MRMLLVTPGLSLLGCSSARDESSAKPDSGATHDGSADERVASPAVSGVACRLVNEIGSISATVTGVAVLGCDASTPDGGGSSHASRKAVREGRVSSVEPGGFDVDSCAGDAACDPPVHVAVSADGLDLPRALPVGALVRVTGETGFWLGSCLDQSLVVESLDEWNGATNPARAEAGLYLAVSLNGGTRGAGPFRIYNEWLDCAFDAGAPYACGDSELWVGLYAFRLEPSKPGSSPTILPMGETVSVPIAGTSERWLARDLMSYQTEHCDDYWRWAYWVALDR